MTTTDHDVHGLIDAAEQQLRRWDTPLEATLVAVVDRRITEQVATLAVELRADGVARLLINPGFARDIGAEGLAFVLCHEALHLLLGHLRFQGARDAAWRLACEAVINHWVIRTTGRALPVSRRTGQPVGIDPRVLHREWRAATGQRVGYERFVATDERCAALLRELPDPGHDDRGWGCGAGHDAADPAGQAEALDAALGSMADRARRGDTVLRDQLLALEDAVPGAPGWARSGVSELRATTRRAGLTRLWEQQLAHVVGQTLAPALEARYDRKVGWWDAALLAPLGIAIDPDAGMPLTLAPATRRHRQVAIYLDTSGSIPDQVITAAARTVGELAGTDTHWRAFDHEVHAFRPGEALPGGGGTCFRAVADDVAALEATLTSPLDAVVVLTDGYGERIAPPRCERWIWLIVADGDPWPRDHGMRTVTVPDLR